MTHRTCMLKSYLTTVSCYTKINILKFDEYLNLYNLITSKYFKLSTACVTP